MNHRLETATISLLASVAMAGIIASTTEDLGGLTLVSIPGWVQIPGVILVGVLIGFASRTSVTAFIALLTASVLGGILQGLAISIAALGVERSTVHLINRGTTQGFYALIVIFFIGMAGVVAALVVNVFARRIELQE